MHTLSRFFLPFAALFAVGCDRDAAPTPATTGAPSASVQVKVDPVPVEPAEVTACRERIARLTALPALPGAPGFEARRPEILGRGKGEAVVFLRAPQLAQGLGLRLELIRGQMSKKSPILGIPGTLDQLRYAPEDARKLLLAEGYVYSESPEVASVLIDVLKLGRLFREPELWMARGGEVFRLERDKTGAYRHADGERKGDEPALLLGDRVALRRDELLPLLHRDLSPVVEAHAPERVRIVRLTEQGAVVDLRYGDDWVPAALDDDGQRYSVACTAPPAARREQVAARRAVNLQRAGSVARLRDAVRAMVDERLRFDEPLEEVGQQDGSLRPLWKWAYDHDGSTYSFNGVGYQVFDTRGRPAPPQVCVDFVLDAYERASGAWYGGVGQPRQRSAGSINFENSDLRNRRSAAEVVAFASRHPEMFDVWNLPDEERIPFGRRSDFFGYLTSHADRFSPGAIVVIHGMKADGLAHYHSFLIESSDPITGFPYRLAGNAGRPRLQSWEGVMRSAPLRSVRHVVAPRDTWLGAVLPPAAPAVAHR